MFESRAIDQLPLDGEQWRCPTLLDANAIDDLLAWLERQPDFIGRLVDATWRIAVLREHLEPRPDKRQITEKLKTFQVQIVSAGKPNNALIEEMQLAYFGGQISSSKSAQVLAYGRQHSDGAPVRVISRHRGFGLVPNVERFFIPGLADIGNEDDAMYLRALTMLDLHKHVRRTAFERVVNHDYPVAVSETTKMLIDEVRKIGEIHSLTFARNINDQPMVDQAIRNEEHDSATGKKKKVTPAIRLNDNTLPSHESEQKGYRDLMCGVVSAVRNPTSHAPADKDFIQERFGDRRTALKFLCLLSLLFEKLDARVAP